MKWLDFIVQAWMFFVCAFFGAVGGLEIAGVSGLSGAWAIPVVVVSAGAGLVVGDILVRNFL